MKKKLLTIVVLIALAMAPTFAKSSDMSVGLAAGTINGVGFKYALDRESTLGAVVAFDVLTLKNVNAEAFYLYKATEVKIDKLVFDINVGGGASIGIPFSGGAFSISPLAMGEISYSFDGDLPIDLLLRLEPGLKIDFGNPVNFGFAFQGSVQALWRL